MAQSSSSSASSSTAPDSDYDVFINYRGLDVKKTFASLLYRRLKSHGLRVFLDQHELQRGEYLIPQIEAAIGSASVHVAIFSKGYAESTWCLQELVLMLESNFPVIPVFYRVKPEELRWARGKEGGYAKALEELEKKTTADPDTGEKKLRYEASLIKKWRNALSQAAGISGFDLEACNSDEGELLDNVVEGVLKKVKKPAKYPTGWTGAAANTISSVVTVAIASPSQLIDDVIHLDRNTQLLDIAELNRMKTLLLHMANQRSPPDTVDNWLERLHNSLDDAKCVVDRAQPQKRWLQCFLHCFLCRPTLSTQVRKWNANFHRLFVDLERDFSILGNTEQTVSSAPLLQRVPQALLQPVPQSGFVGKRIKDDQDRLQRWLENEDHQFCIIGVYGMGGIGKTSLLKTVFNAYKKGNLFEAVIWTVVSQNCSISGLQADIAKQINLHLGSRSSVELAKMELFACLREKKFLLILDDLWTDLQLDEELGIPVDNDKGSRALISTRSFDVLKRMGADDFSIQMQPLSRDEGWQLFCRGAFKTGSAPTEDIENVATQIAGECNGLPLAINVIAAAMKGKASVNDWHLALCQIKNMDPTFLRYTRIDRGLYWRLKMSYDYLPDSVLKNCFLYCATFPEDWSIYVNDLVEMWIGEGLVKSRETSYLMDLGLTYVDLLVERCLFQSFYKENGCRNIQVHDVVHDLAMYIAEKVEQCLFRTRQNLQEFPAAEKGIRNCKRIAIGHNNISDLPTDFSCPNLLYLSMQYNESLREVPDSFLVNLNSLRVLDLSGTKIESLPMSAWHLKQLQYLSLDGTLIKYVPEDICSLSQLQFLHLNRCKNLESLPPKIRELQNLKTLDLSYCCSLTGIPPEISQLTSLNVLLLWTSETAENSIMEVEEVKSSVCSLKDLTNCSNLVQLHVHVKAGIEVEGIRAGIKMGIMGSWLDMRDLTLIFDAEDHDVLEDLPTDMQSMKKLQHFWLQNYHGRSLPNCICEFPQLERLYLWRCFQLRDLPPLERLPNLRSLTLHGCTNLKELGIGAWGSVRGFPMLESLTLETLPMLESLGSSSSDIVWNEQMLPKLQVLTIKDCPSLKGLPGGIDKLPDLETIKVQQNWWEKNDGEIFLKEKLHHSIVFIE